MSPVIELMVVIVVQEKGENWSNMTHVFWDEVLEFAQMNHGAVYDEGWCVRRVAG